MKLIPISPINTAILATIHDADTFGDDAIEGRRPRRERRQRRRQRRGEVVRKPRSGKKRPPAEQPAPRHPMRRPLRSMRPPLPAEESDYEELPVEEEFEDFEDYDEELEAELEAELGRLPIPRGALKTALRRARERVRRGRGRPAPPSHKPRGGGGGAGRPPRPPRGGGGPGAGPPPPPPPPSPAPTDAWGPVSRLGSNIRIQAGNGHRAAILPLRPGLWIVADVAEQSVLPPEEGGFGLAPILPGLMLRAVRSAVQSGRERRAERRAAPYQTTAVAPSRPLTLAGMVGCTWCTPEELT